VCHCEAGSKFLLQIKNTTSCGLCNIEGISYVVISGQSQINAAHSHQQQTAQPLGLNDCTPGTAISVAAEQLSLIRWDKAHKLDSLFQQIKPGWTEHVIAMVSGHVSLLVSISCLL